VQHDSLWKKHVEGAMLKNKNDMMSWYNQQRKTLKQRRTPISSENCVTTNGLRLFDS